MKNNMYNNLIKASTSALFVAVISFGALGFAPAAHAQFDSSGDYSGGCCDFGSYSTGTDYGYQASTPSYSTGTDYGYPADYSTPSYSTGTDYGYTPTPYYDTLNYGGTGGYMGGGYVGGGYMTGGYTGGGYMTGGGYGGGYVAPVAPSNTYAPTTVTDTTTTNTCTGNSCNSDDHSVVNITNPAPVINNNNVVANYAPTPAPVLPVQQYCANGYSGVYPNCYLNRAPIAQPVVYGNTPYVSLSQVPYTGLDLGFWGSIAYWGAFVLFALFAAYLIAIKRVQNSIAAYLKSVLFGTDEEVEVETTTTTDTTPTPAPVAVAATNGDVIDSFIMSQINRARA
jgi:hypothetical protein